MIHGTPLFPHLLQESLLNGRLMAKNWYVMGVRDSDPAGTAPHKISRTYNVQDAAAVFADLAKKTDCSKHPDTVYVASSSTFVSRDGL